MRKYFLIIYFFITYFAFSQKYDQIISQSYLNDYGYEFLRNVCDRFGGRLMGTENNTKSFEFLQQQLKENKIGYKVEEFTAPCYIRGNEFVQLVFPFNRELKSISIGYSPAIDTICKDVVLLKSLDDKENYKDKIILYVKNKFTGELPKKEKLSNILFQYQAKALLIANDNTGYTNLVSTGSFEGNEIKIPIFSITYEDAQILLRQIENNIVPKVKIYNNSKIVTKQVPNIISTYQGKQDGKIVVIAHFDSWDLGQGAIDNGIGSAIVYNLINVFNKVRPNTLHSIDFVFVNGEELGLFGSKNYYEKHKNEKILLCINLDMVGQPYGFNVMGYDTLKSIIEEFNTELKGYNLNKVISTPWLNSDHMYFMINGIPSITPLAKLDEFKIQYYHDFTDTFEKVNKQYISDATAIIGSLIVKMANLTNLSSYQLDKPTTEKMLEKFKLLEEVKNR
jgi:Iap family predicted aminopeptidase